MKNHIAWQKGLGVSCNLAALDPDLVQPVGHQTAVENLSEMFRYDSEIVNNADPAARMFRSCQELHPGVCRSHALFDVTMHMAQQLQGHLDCQKLDPPVLFRVDVDLSACASSSSISKPLNRAFSWYMLGSIRKRPLCRIFAKFVRMPAFQGTVHPEVVNGSFTMVTCYEVILDALKWAQTEFDDWEGMCVKFIVEEHLLIGTDGVPNHALLVGSDAAEAVTFTVGPKLDIPSPPKKPRQTTGQQILRFGLKAADTKRKRAPKRKRAEAVADKAEAEVASNSDPDPDPDDESWESLGAFGDAFSAKLSLQQFKELKQAVVCAKGADQDEENEQEDGGKLKTKESTVSNAKKKRQTAKRSDPSAAGPTFAADGAPAPSLPQPKRSLDFNHDIGIVSMKPTVRAGVCNVCSREVSKGELRLEVAFSKK